MNVVVHDWQKVEPGSANLPNGTRPLFGTCLRTDPDAVYRFYPLERRDILQNQKARVIIPVTDGYLLSP